MSLSTFRWLRHSCVARKCAASSGYSHQPLATPTTNVSSKMRQRTGRPRRHSANNKYQLTVNSFTPFFVTILSHFVTCVIIDHPGGIAWLSYSRAPGHRPLRHRSNFEVDQPHEIYSQWGICSSQKDAIYENGIEVRSIIAETSLNIGTHHRT